MVRLIQILTSPAGSKRLTLAAVSCIALAGTVLILYSTAIAPWAFSDSTAYLTTAQNIAAGRGVVLQDTNNTYTLLSHHAPLFPLVLSLPIALGVDALQAVRWLNAVLYGLTIFLAAWATRRFTCSFWLAISVAILCLFSYEPLLAFTSAMSEGLFIFFCFLTLVILTLAILETRSQNRLLVFAGLAAGLAALTRYIGLSLLAVGALAILLLVKSSFKTRLLKAVYFLLPAGFLTALWFVPVYFSTHTLGGWPIDKNASAFEASRSYFGAFWDVFGSWLPFFYRGNHIITPGQKLFAAGAILVILLLIAIWRIHKKSEPFDKDGLLTWIWVLGLFMLGYVGFHLATYVLALEEPAVNGRLLLPIFYAGVLLAAALAGFISRTVARTWLGGLAFTALALLTIWYFHSSVKLYVYEMHHYGMGYTSNRWNENRMFDQIADLDDSYTQYSNDSSLVLFYTGRIPKSLVPAPDRTAYEWPQTGKDAVILFIGMARKDLGEAYPGFVESLQSGYQTIYEGNEGMIFIPRQP